jgi:hypothetical protein
MDIFPPMVDIIAPGAAAGKEKKRRMGRYFLKSSIYLGHTRHNALRKIRTGQGDR